MSLTTVDVSSLPRLDPLSKFYTESYAVFNASTDKNEKISEWISSKFEEEIISRLLKTELGDEHVTLSVLGIGSGDGKLEVKMLKKLMKKFRLIECTVVEPSGERISSYKKLVEEEKDALHCVTFDWRQETIQEFCNVKADGLKKFNFVSAIHACYFIAKQDLNFHLNTIFGWTKGTILIMILGEDGFLSRLQKKFHGPAYAPKAFTYANSITDSFRSLDISFETSALPCECDVTRCFESDSRDGKLLLDFLLQRVGCREDGPPELLKRVKEFVDSEDISYTRSGRIYVEIPTQVIIGLGSKDSKT